MAKPLKNFSLWRALCTRFARAQARSQGRGVQRSNCTPNQEKIPLLHPKLKFRVQPEIRS